MMAGQVAALVHERGTTEHVIADLVAQAEERSTLGLEGLAAERARRAQAR